MDKPKENFKLNDEDAAEYMQKKQAKSLLEKYDIPISHLDYGYIAECEDTREMERIVVILKSGEEGFYPDLLQKALDRLTILKPTSKYLRVDEPILRTNQLNTETRKEVMNNFSEWCGDMQGFETDLKSSSIKFKSPAAQAKARRLIPDVRNSTSFMTDSGEKRRTNNTKRIASCDYASWDKYDPDTEILKMDLEEEKTREKVEKEKAERDCKITKKKNQQTLIDLLSHRERTLFADRRRIAGNESFKCGDYKVALVHYNESIDYLETPAAYNNRAATYLKLGRFQEASNDCYKVLALEPDNMKALIRKGEALVGLKDYSKALEYYERAIKIDPNNTIAQKGAYECNTHLNKSIKTVRMRIQEDEPKSSVVIEEIDNSQEISAYQNGLNNHEELTPKIIELNDSKCEVETNNIDIENKGFPLNHMVDESAYNIVNGYQKNKTEDSIGTMFNGPTSISSKEKKVTLAKPKSRTCLVPIASTSDFRGPTVIEITIPEDVPISSIDPSLSHSVTSRREVQTSTDFDDYLIEQVEHNMTIEESCKSDQKYSDECIDKLPQEFTIYCDEQNEENTAASTSGNDIDQNDAEGSVEKEGAVEEQIEEKSDTTTQNPDGNARVPLQERDVRRQIKLDKRRARRAERNSSNFLLSFMPNHDIGSTGVTGKIEIASKYKKFTNRADSFVNNKLENVEEDNAPRVQLGRSLTEKQIKINERIRQNQLAEGNASCSLTPYEFLKSWESIKHDDDFSARAQILRSLIPNSLKSVIGNKLDAKMLTGMLQCLRRHFLDESHDTDANYVADFLNALCELPRFSVIAMFLDNMDKQNLKEIINYVDNNGAKLCCDIRKYAA